MRLGNNNMNDEPSFNQQQGAEDAAVTTKGIAPSLYFHQCPSCPKSYPTKQALRMHVGRAHTKTIVNTVPSTREEKRRRKKLKAAQLRARYREQGLSSRGTSLKDPDHYTRRYAHPWSAAQHKKFKRTLKRKKLMYVYPVPKDQPISLDKPVEATTNKVCFCPYCGNNIEAVINL